MQMQAQDSTPVTAGKVARLWRYPVKSMLGQPAEALEIVPGGVAGDRCLAVRDGGGRPASGKSMEGFARIQNLLDFSAGSDGDTVCIRFPDGREHRADDPDIDAALSQAIGQTVTLTTEDDGRHVDASPIHLLTEASLAWLRATLPEAVVDERRFRPNLVLDVGGEGRVERDWIGRHLRIGAVELRITEETVRCGMVSMAHADLPRDPRVLRHLTREAEMCLGVYADVVTPGPVALGDRVELIDT